MKRLGLYSLIALLLLASELWAETQGTFRGEVVRPPREDRSPGLLYLMGRDGNVRRVVVARAAIVYDSSVQGDHRQPAGKALVPGTEVRVTALVDANSGEWTASRVEVIPNHAGEFEDDYLDDSARPPNQVAAPSETMIAARTI